MTTFVGFAPADDPQYVVAVDLERPTSSAEVARWPRRSSPTSCRYALTADGIVPSGTARPDFVLTDLLSPPGPTSRAPEPGAGPGRTRAAVGRTGVGDHAGR